MLKETQELAQAIENLIGAVLVQVQPVVVNPAPLNEPVAPAPKNVAPVVPAPVAPAAPTAPAAPAPSAAPGPVTHDEVRNHLLPIIQSNQEAMTAVHSVLTQQFKVNELTSLPVASIPAFMDAVNQALAA